MGAAGPTIPTKAVVIKVRKAVFPLPVWHEISSATKAMPKKCCRLSTVR